MSASERQQIVTDGIVIDNFTMMPNIAFELSPNAFKLLAIYIDFAKTKTVYAKNSTLAERLGVSVNTMKKARQQLADAGYIIYAPGKDGDQTTTARVTIQVQWMWSENHKQTTDDEPETVEGVSNSDRGVSNIDTLVSNSDTNKQDLYNKSFNKQDSTPKNTVVDKESDAPDTVSKFGLVLSRLEKAMVIPTKALRDLFVDDFDEYPVSLWDAAIDTLLEQRKEKSIGHQYRYLMGILKGMKARQDTQPPPQPTPGYLKPAQPLDMSISDEERKAALAIFAANRPGKEKEAS